LKYVFQIVGKLKREGVAVIYISHRLEEIFEICDEVSVFRDGQLVDTCMVRDTDKSSLIRHMVNRPLNETFPKIALTKGERVLEVRKLCTTLLEDISFSAYRGERLGFAGLIGAGRTEVMRALFGADPIKSGEVFLNGKKIRVLEPSDAIEKGIALIPEDRKRQGALLHLSVGENISIVDLKNLAGPGGIINRKKENEKVLEYTRELRIKTPSSAQLVKNLSGGNQQKVVLAKWLLVDSEVIIFDEPTRGIDVGAKQEIYNLINTLALSGKVIILISSEMPELLGMSDRIIVMAEGRITGELDIAEASQEKIMHFSSM
jgi:ribose transport system ATP-binding protein